MRKSKKKMTAKPGEDVSELKNKVEEKKESLQQDEPATKVTKRSDINGVPVKYHDGSIDAQEHTYITGLKLKDIKNLIGENNTEINEWGKGWNIDLGDHQVLLHGYDGNSWQVSYTGDKDSFQKTIAKAFPKAKINDEADNMYDTAQDNYESDTFDELQSALDSDEIDDPKYQKMLRKMVKDMESEEIYEDDDN